MWIKSLKLICLKSLIMKWLLCVLITKAHSLHLLLLGHSAGELSYREYTPGHFLMDCPGVGGVWGVGGESTAYSMFSDFLTFILTVPFSLLIKPD